MSTLSPMKSMQFAYGSEFYEVVREYDSSVTGFTGDYEYFAYKNSIGKWIIQQHKVSTGVYLYINGATDFSTAWTNKGSLSYDEYEKMVNTSP